VENRKWGLYFPFLFFLYTASFFFFFAGRASFSGRRKEEKTNSGGGRDCTKQRGTENEKESESDFLFEGLSGHVRGREKKGQE